MKGIYLKFKNALGDGLFYILISGFFTQVIGFFSSTLVIRFLPKTEYGNYVSANNLYSYLTVFIGMGFASAILQFCSENRSREEKNDIYCFALKQGTAFNLVLFFLICVLAALKWKSSESVGQYLFMMSGLPFFTYYSSYFQVVLRIRNLNKEYSFVGMANAGSIFAVNMIFAGILGTSSLILSQYAGSLISTVLSICYLRRAKAFDLSFADARKLETEDKKAFRRYALLIAVTNFTSSILVLIDITCLDLLVCDPQLLAGYKVASMVPNAMLFLSSSVIVYYYPKLVRLYSGDRYAFLAELKAIRRMLVIINGIIALGMFLFAPFILTLLFGNQYRECTPIFRILCLNYFVFSSYRKLYGNVIAMIKKVNINFINTSLAGILNTVLNIILIQKYGAIGATGATICVSAFTTAFSFLYFQRFMKKEQESGSM